MCVRKNYLPARAKKKKETKKRLALMSAFERITDDVATAYIYSSPFFMLIGEE